MRSASRAGSGRSRRNGGGRRGGSGSKQDQLVLFGRSTCPPLGRKGRMITNDPDRVWSPSGSDRQQSLHREKWR